MRVDELRQWVVDTFLIQDDIADRLLFSYNTYIGKSGNRKKVVLEDDDVIKETQHQKMEGEETTDLTIQEVEMIV
jgi:hypothetical protein